MDLELVGFPGLIDSRADVTRGTAVAMDPRRDGVGRVPGVDFASGVWGGAEHGWWIQRGSGFPVDRVTGARDPGPVWGGSDEAGRAGARAGRGGVRLGRWIQGWSGSTAARIARLVESRADVTWSSAAVDPTRRGGGGVGSTEGGTISGVCPEWRGAGCGRIPRMIEPRAVVIQGPLWSRPESGTQRGERGCILAWGTQ